MVSKPPYLNREKEYWHHGIGWRHGQSKFSSLLAITYLFAHGQVT